MLCVSGMGIFAALMIILSGWCNCLFISLVVNTVPWLRMQKKFFTLTNLKTNIVFFIVGRLLAGVVYSLS